MLTFIRLGSKTSGQGSHASFYRMHAYRKRLGSTCNLKLNDQAGKQDLQDSKLISTASVTSLHGKLLPAQFIPVHYTYKKHMKPPLA